MKTKITRIIGTAVKYIVVQALGENTKKACKYAIEYELIDRGLEIFNKTLRICKRLALANKTGEKLARRYQAVFYSWPLSPHEHHNHNYKIGKNQFKKRGQSIYRSNP